MSFQTVNILFNDLSFVSLSNCSIRSFPTTVKYAYNYKIKVVLRYSFYNKIRIYLLILCHLCEKNI